MLPCKSTAEEVSFEWSHHRISSTDSKVQTTLNVTITDSGTEMVESLESKEESFSFQVTKSLNSWLQMTALMKLFLLESLFRPQKITR